MQARRSPSTASRHEMGPFCSSAYRLCTITTSLPWNIIAYIYLKFVFGKGFPWFRDHLNNIKYSNLQNSTIIIMRVTSCWCVWVWFTFPLHWMSSPHTEVVPTTMNSFLPVIVSWLLNFMTFMDTTCSNRPNGYLFNAHHTRVTCIVYLYRHGYLVLGTGSHASGE